MASRQLNPSRLATVRALQELNHALMAHRLEDATLDCVTESLSSLLDWVRASPQRDRPSGWRASQVFTRQWSEGADHALAFPERPVGGPANPTAAPMGQPQPRR